MRSVVTPAALSGISLESTKTDRSGGATTSQGLPTPRAGSLPKKATLQVPVPASVLVTQRVSTPKRTVCVPVVVKVWFSLAILTQVVEAVGAGTAAGVTVPLEPT